MFGKDFNSPEELYEAVGKQVRTMPQIQIDGELIGGYNQLVEYFVEKGKVNFKGGNCLILYLKLIEYTTTTAIRSLLPLIESMVISINS